jgi:putative ABC transport system permease protein
MSPSEKEIQIAGRTVEGDLNAVNGTLAMRHTTGMPYLEDISVNTSLALVQELMQTKGVARTVLYLKDESDIPTVVKSLSNDFQKRGLDLEALSYRDDRIGEFYNGSISFMYTMAGFFGALILGASALIIVNSLTMSLLERTREIGTLRAIGYTSGRLKNLFIKEAVVLAMMSSVAGIIVTEILAKLINLGGFKLEVPGVSYQIEFQVIVEFWFYFVAAGGMIALTAVCSYWVVRRKMEEKIYHLLLESGAVS